MVGGTRKVVHVEEEAKMAPEKEKNASRERGKGVWNRQGQVTLRVANPVVVSTIPELDYASYQGAHGACMAYTVSG